MNVSALSIQARSPHRPMPLRAISIILLAASGWLNAAPGDPDPSFGFGGTLVTHIARADYCESVALQADGKIVAAGYSGTNNDFTLVRYLANGKVDSGFGTAGKVVTPIGTDADQAYGLVVQTDGKLVVAGSAGGATPGFALVRYLANGTLDTEFGSGGKVTTPGGNGRSVAIQSDGKIIVAGNSSNGSNLDITLFRYDSTGALDGTFGTGGKVTTAVGSGDDGAENVAVQSDGHIVVAGYSHNGSNTDFALVRYNANGSLDTSFDTDGKVTTAIGGGNDYAFSIVLQGNGSIVAAGRSNNGSNDDFAVVRYNTNGTLDSGFGTGGKVTTQIGAGYDTGECVTLQSDGRIIVGGTGFSASYDFALVRYNTDGSKDPDFGAGGVATIDFRANSDNCQSVVVQSDGKIVLAGSTDNGSNIDFALVRCNTDGTLDRSFGAAGTVTTPVTGEDRAYCMALQADQRILVAGTDNDTGAGAFAVLRYNPDGTLDHAFSDDGKVTTRFASADVCRSVAVQSDGRIVAAGSASNGSNYDFGLVCYQADGTLDSGFGSSGKVVTPFGTSLDSIYDMAIQSDGMIVAVGMSMNGTPPQSDFALARYHSNGTLDNTFGSGGKVTTPIGGGDDYAYGVAIQTDGRILVAGTSFNGTDFDFALLRYNADGTPDTSFASGGKLLINKDSDFATCVIVQPDETILLAGICNLGVTLIRCNPNGSLDSGFGTGGIVTTAVGRANSIALQSDGRILVAGDTSGGTDSDFLLLRYEPDGTLDAGFGSGGRIAAPIGSGYDSARGVVLQSDGRIVVAGYTWNGINHDFAVMRFEGDAPLDNDMDGVMDAWETANGFSPAIAFDVFNLDSDGDGDLDLLEIYQGTGRNDPGQRFGLQEPAAGFAPGSHQLKARIRRASQTAVNATLLWSTDLTNWHGSGQSGGGVTVVMTEAIVGSGTGYQIVEITATVSAGTPAKLFLMMRVEPND